MATVKVTGTGGSWGDGRKKAFYDPFRNGSDPWKNEHKLDFTAQGLGQYLAKLTNKPDEPNHDLYEMRGPAARRLGEAGALAKQKGNVDSWSEIPEYLRNDYHASTLIAPYGIAWNKGKIDKEFNSWEDLLDSDFEGKMGLPGWGDMWGDEFFYTVNAALGGDLDNLDPGFNYIQELVEKTDPVLISSIDEARKLFKQEEIWISSFLSARTENITLNTEGEVEMGWKIPQEGTWFDSWSWGVAKNRSEDTKQGAFEFLDGAYSPGPQAQFAQVFGYPPAHPDSYELLPDDVIENHPNIKLSDAQLEALSQLDIDWLQVRKQQSEDANRWRQIVRG